MSNPHSVTKPLSSTTSHHSRPDSVTRGISSQLILRSHGHCCLNGLIGHNMLIVSLYFSVTTRALSHRCHRSQRISCLIAVFGHTADLVSTPSSVTSPILSPHNHRSQVPVCLNQSIGHNTSFVSTRYSVTPHQSVHVLFDLTLSLVSLTRLTWTFGHSPQPRIKSDIDPSTPFVSKDLSVTRSHLYQCTFRPHHVDCLRRYSVSRRVTYQGGHRSQSLIHPPHCPLRSQSAQRLHRSQ